MISFTLTIVVLVVSGTYLLLYLYRWEWNRAVVSGVFFIAALVTFSTAMVLRALGRLTERVEAVEHARAARDRAVRDVAGSIGEANADAATRRRFSWLERPPDGPAVFVPVLLGTGVLLSFAAWVLERLAGALAGGPLDRKTAVLLDPDLPLGTGPLRRPARGVEAPARTRAGRALGWVLAGAMLLLLFVGMVDAIRDATMSRVEDLEDPGTTEVVLWLEQRRDPRPADVIGLSLWTACRLRVPEDVTLVSLTAVDDDEVRIVLDRSLGPLGQRRFFGCLQDFTLDLVQAHVTDVVLTPA